MKSWLQTETVDTAECSAGVFEVMRKKKETKEAKNRMGTEDERLCRVEQMPESEEAEDRKRNNLIDSKCCLADKEPRFSRENI